ncbi:hypothetical protein BDW59DRAFT_164141 [Aspergillus cavernicola]|uniref:Fungal-type protein kinase domain-containing protein n=1 Tax=Aspergillus cavernicola TaxID=176166 RepID=A0ABR4I0W6_9EURO
MPRATYRGLPFTKYADKIKNPQQDDARGGRIQSREDVVDHLWTNILVYYFQNPRPMTFSVERESYLLNNRRQKTDIAVVNLVGPDADMQKVLNFEAKCPLGPPNNRKPTDDERGEVRAQLRNNMGLARRADQSTQDIYGVVAIGTWARLYKLPGGETFLVPIRRCNGEFEFNVWKHHIAIQREMTRWAREIAEGASSTTSAQQQA